MKVSNRIMLACTTFMLTAAAIANPNGPVYADDPAPQDPAHEVLLPGTMVVAGDPEKHDFYIANEKDAIKIVEAFKLAKLEAEAKVLAAKHNETHKDIKFDKKTLTALNVDMKKVLNKYAAFDGKVTIAKVQDKVSTQQFAPTAAKTTTPPPATVETKHAAPVVAKSEPVTHALEPAELPKLKTPEVEKPLPVVATKKVKQPSRDRAVPVVARVKSKPEKVVAKKTLANKVPTKSIKPVKPAKTIAVKKSKKVVVGVVKPYIPEKPIAKRKSVAAAKPTLKSRSPKYVVKSLTYDQNHKLKLVDKPLKTKLSLKKGAKKVAYHFEVVHLYR